jgi:hypothetical protein
VVGSRVVSTTEPDGLFGRVVLRVIFDDLFFLFFPEVLVDHLFYPRFFDVCCAEGLCYWKFLHFQIPLVVFLMFLSAMEVVGHESTLVLYLDICLFVG